MRISDWSSDVCSSDLCIGVGAWVPQPGDLRPVQLQGLPLLLLRDAAGGLRVFHNVCSHRGLRLVAEPCHVGRHIRCPYHSWTYALDGSLKATPFLGGPGTSTCAGLDQAGNGPDRTTDVYGKGVTSRIN